MAKKKKRQTKRRDNQLKRTLKYELSALILLALVIIAMARMGAVGKATVLFFRFWMGEWYMLSILGLLVLSVYLMWKREIPFFFNTKLIGCYLIISSLLLLSHVNNFHLLTNNGRYKDPSIIRNTWDAFMMEINGEASTTGLGGGMIGAVLFALCRRDRGRRARG
jgi:S-DNA-T family DNA segregation ATPase FtsK/SpoIIIE